MNVRPPRKPPNQDQSICATPGVFLPLFAWLAKHLTCGFLLTFSPQPLAECRFHFQNNRTRPAELKIHNQFPGDSASLSTMQRASRIQNLTACSDYVHSLPDQTTICKYKKIIVNSQWLPKHKKTFMKEASKNKKNIHRFIMFSLNHMFIDIFMFSQIISS